MYRLSPLLLIVLFIGILSYASSSEDDSPVVRVEQGLIKGMKEVSLNGKEFYSFKSIPFAKPPLGNLRFKDPAPAEAWEGTLDGTKDPDACLQTNIFKFTQEDTSVVFGSEDCLLLNVYTAKTSSDENRPVMVFIHGGAFVVGSVGLYGPYTLMDEDIVLVFIQYRLGIFGFLSTEDSVLPGNMGLKDQQMALKWIQSNIRQFGGDPGRVTIFGESAGGASVDFQILSPGSKGLFQRAIAQSGTAICPWAYNKDHRAFAAMVGGKHGCFINEGERFLDCMQNVEATKLLHDSTQTLRWGFTPLYVLPRVDGVFLPDCPLKLLKNEMYNKVDVIMGTTRDEGAFSLFLMYNDPRMLHDLENNFDSTAPFSIVMHGEADSLNLTRKVYQHYLKKENLHLTEEDDENLVKLYSDTYFGICNDVSAHYYARDEDISLYLYQFDHVGAGSILNFNLDIKKEWVAHSDDLFYLFSGTPYFTTLTKELRKSDAVMRNIMVKLWTNFAETGNPNSNGFEFHWKKADSDKFSHLSLTASPKMKDDSFQEVRKFWKEINVKTYPTFEPKLKPKESQTKKEL